MFTSDPVRPFPPKETIVLLCQNLRYLNFRLTIIDTRLLCYKRLFLEIAIALLVSLSVLIYQAMGVMGIMRIMNGQ